MNQNTPQLDEAARLHMASEVMELFEQWRVSLDHQHSLLGLPDTVKKRHLYKYAEGLPLPEDSAVLERAIHLMGIADALRTYFPNSAHARSRFMRSHSKKFSQRTPLQIMVEDGVSGLIRIRSHLDCTYAWDLSGSKG